MGGGTDRASAESDAEALNAATASFGWLQVATFNPHAPYISDASPVEAAATRDELFTLLACSIADFVATVAGARAAARDRTVTSDRLATVGDSTIVCSGRAVPGNDWDDFRCARLPVRVVCATLGAEHRVRSAHGMRGDSADGNGFGPGNSACHAGSEPYAGR